jgi:predicted metal-binding membrane protein
MTPAARERMQVRTPMLLMSGAAWILLAFEPVPHCSPAALAQNLPSASLGWALMLAAMMLPVLIAPVRHVRDRSFARRRPRAIALFIAAYAAIWMACGFLLMGARQLLPQSPTAVALAILLVVVWECSPAKQRCLNRGHAHPELPAFGRAADLGALRFGWTHAVWCVGSCWALMFLPLLVSRGHLAAMAAVSLWLFAERLDRPMPPRWGFRAPAKAARLILARVPVLYRQVCPGR